MRNVRNMGKRQRIWVEMYWPTLSRQYLSVWKISGRQTAKASLIFALHTDAFICDWRVYVAYQKDYQLLEQRDIRFNNLQTDFLMRLERFFVQKPLNCNSYLLVKNKIQVKGALTWSLLLHIFLSSRRWKREQQKSKEKYAKTHFHYWTRHRFLLQKHQSWRKPTAIHIIP